MLVRHLKGPEGQGEGGGSSGRRAHRPRGGCPAGAAASAKSKGQEGRARRNVLASLSPTAHLAPPAFKPRQEPWRGSPRGAEQRGGEAGNNQHVRRSITRRLGCGASTDVRRPEPCGSRCRARLMKFNYFGKFIRKWWCCYILLNRS